MARLVDGGVLVEDAKEASTLLNKGSFGEPQAAGALMLDLVEAAYLASENRLEVEGADVADLAAAGAASDPQFETRFLAYRDLRGRTLPVRFGEGGRLLAFDRGATPGKDAATLTVLPVSERAPLAPAEILAEADAAASRGRRLLAALVDEEGDLTYYAVAEKPPKGSAPEPGAPPQPVHAAVLHERVLLPRAPAALAEAGYGRALGTGLQLPFVEALHLADRGWLALDAAAVRAAARRAAPDFDLQERVYRDLRARGLLVRTGFKFGTHFRAYRKAADGEHSPYLVHALPESAAESAPKVAGFVRLAHAVRKTLLFALVGDAGIRYVAFERTRP